MAKLAFMTTGPLSKVLEDPQNGSYGVLANEVFAELGLDDGLLEGFTGDDPEQKWGVWTIPKLYEGEEYIGRILQTLSVWRDLEAVYAYSYHGVHAEALRRRDEWFPKIPLPNHVAWWIDEAHTPTWAEGAALYDRIAKEGSNPDAFNLRQPYDADGNTVTPNRERIKEKAKLYRKSS